MQSPLDQPVRRFVPCSTECNDDTSDTRRNGAARLSDRGPNSTKLSTTKKASGNSGQGRQRRATGSRARKGTPPPTVHDIVPESALMFPILPERPVDAAAIEALVETCFGPDRMQKTVYKFRDGVPPISELSFVVKDGRKVEGSIRYWPVTIGADEIPAILLGPLCIAPDRQGQGIGRALMRHSLYAATRMGHRLCVLVGDKAYYEPFGFRNAPAVGLELPGWVDPERFQYMELVPGAVQGVAGMVAKAPFVEAARRGRRKAA
jgi:predicted N-acetyltransferase YhbS